MTAFSLAERAAMLRAIAIAASPDAPAGPNPRVGCVIVSPAGDVLAEGHHRGAGTAHAEVDALTSLAAKGISARGTTAVVTLEPCNHQGRTGPCTQALLDAGVATVVYALADPTAQARGGAEALAAAGVSVKRGIYAEQAAELIRPWLFAVTTGRPMVTWKLAATLDGRIAAADATSRWITSATARHDAHRLRRDCDAIMVGTGTVLADDPALTIRDQSGRPAPDRLQPLRVVAGSRPIPPTAQVLADANHLLLPQHDPHAVLATLASRQVRHVLLEGGPTLAAAFLRAGLIDEVVAYIAPALLGAGPAAVADFGVSTIADILRLEHVKAEVLGAGEDLVVRVAGEPGGRHRAVSSTTPLTGMNTEEIH
ncbi:bifunctional diaminohydroxyphosphoribosylaminopyrimidine deaminase/5-amino-6-(5-phosphoribosylamino)uracil reductase RibD [Actinomyces sp. 565]|uniref:bifunctional diaminohydroxyphosphoribosylaminopyrimidine deaminase/5-amino-6-(5-phosphoribosylamino)uracil reductase RibD n=1 Tax=Actinomyces sp. 565 TaxID=2057794 RepID=UPI0013A6F0AC|nr:bifunctional diaminohydroxyphosphoribosylaminopyrimidine deaminase/5-amino-6-(5-phosphoribosylamino)uracil reductase RibD [Actinomyces sp. 565]NDR52528.1 bifunctional diaminohydroxyphosphoribosylaminopyrimidine deaminase/5-amino-6-(5-phosphoribosylamino)uracil reductase RibD [Actinomyces sp. 565]